MTSELTSPYTRSLRIPQAPRQPQPAPAAAVDSDDHGHRTVRPMFDRREVSRSAAISERDDAGPRGATSARTSRSHMGAISLPAIAVSRHPATISSRTLGRRATWLMVALPCRAYRTAF